MVPSQHSVLKGAFEWIVVVAIALVATFLIRSFVVEPFVVPPVPWSPRSRLATRSWHKR